MPGQRDPAEEVLEFWFVQSAAFDGLVRDRFLGLTRRAIAGELGAWSTAAPSVLREQIQLPFQLRLHPHADHPRDNRVRLRATD